ncbi:hypothetical protein L2E82_39665 [Cichorium intybus]|uniref:Uncharacterized protein n=1 Tax=Cichorium intybus TaxID=13427 RepID=A0ACB9AI76_CICIN|nr:hypothetical protein L2E82_39665 [Cichorium intybus]
MQGKSFILAISLLLWVCEARASLAKPGCQEICGNLTVPYPFGMGTGCYLRKSFEVSCNKSSQEVRFVKNGKFTILEISMESVRIVDTSSLYCSDSKNGSHRHIIVELDAHFSFSHKRNVYIAVGCDVTADFLLFGAWHFRAVGCSSNCLANTVNGSFTCNGTNGCCQSSIPVETNTYHVEIFNYVANAPCSHTFVMEKGYALPTLPDIFGDIYHIPVALNWVIAKTTCHQARETGNYLCGQNSQCVDSTKGWGHNCYCMKGYSGNPYLPTGCQDINECLNQSNYPCRENQLCINTPGSYHCTSPYGHILIILVIIATVTGIVAVGAVGHWTYQELGRRNENKIKQDFFKRNGGYLLKQHITANKSHVMKIKIYDSKVIEKATDGFSQSRLLGKGGQGTVYKGFLTDGTVVAVKRLNVVDEDQVEKFVNEVFILAQINHRNIVKLLGCCLEYEVPLLVYEYLSNGTLSQHLHDEAEVSEFSWKDRIRVARDVAGALAYLHSYASPAIFHRDVKPHNILLDKNCRPVVSDFGLSRSIPLSRTHLTTKIEGTFGYLDPVYFQSGQLTEKSDIYAFGVVLTELLTRRKAVSSTNSGEGLVPRFQILVKHNRVLEILDKQLLNDASMDEILQVSKLAGTCLNKNVKKRPSMKEVVMDLDKLKVVQPELPS